MSPATFDLTVTLLSDLHAGSGLGGAGIDALLERDARGLPTVRWTHLRGLLQQALVDRERALGREDGGKLLNELFGTPIRFGEASGRSQIHGTSLRVQGATATASVKVYASTAREPGSRVPKDDTLRRVEYLQAGTVLKGMIQIPADLSLQHLGDDDKSAVALLGNLLRRTDRLGKNRMRGDGRIHLDFSRIEAPMDGSGEIPGDKLPIDGWQHYRLAVRALDPLCLAVTLAPGNIIPGASCISPSGTFGVLAAAALKDNATVAGMFLDGRIEPGASIPFGSMDKFDVTQADALPFPLSYQAPKPTGQADDWPWWMDDAAPATPQDVLAKKADGKLKRPGAHTYLVTRNGGRTWECNEVHLGTRLRNNAGEVQRGFRKDKALFSQEEVPENTVFLSHLRVRADDQEALKAFEAWLASRIGHGDWMFAGRGGTPMQIEQACRVGLPTSTAKPDELQIRLFFETDLIVRRSSQTFHAQLDPDCLADLFRSSGVDVASDAIAGVQFLSEPTTVHGFNAMTGQKRLPAIAIRRGSAAVLAMRNSEAAESLRNALRPMQFQGLGERCAEGYGRFRIDFAPIVSGTTKPPEKPSDPPADETMLHDVKNLLDRHKDCLSSEHGFSTTRLQALRSAVRNHQAFVDWVTAANRAVECATKTGGKSLVAEIEALHKEKEATAPDKPEAGLALRKLERFALEAAKQVQAKERRKRKR